MRSIVDYLDTARKHIDGAEKFVVLAISTPTRIGALAEIDADVRNACDEIDRAIAELRLAQERMLKIIDPHRALSAEALA